MSLHHQSDVKNHLSPHYRTKIHLCEPVSDIAGLSVAAPDAIKTIPAGFAEDFPAEHSSSGAAPALADSVTGSISPQAAAVSKRARA